MQLREIIQGFLELTEEEWLMIERKLIRKEFKAKSTVVAEGNVAREFYYIEKGLMRVFHLQNGREINTYFSCDEQIISTFSSFVTQTPSFEYLEAVEDTVAYGLSFHALTELYKKSPKFERIGRILAEQNYMCILDRTILMQTKTAKEKYLNFIEKNNEKIVLRVPQHHIASFLGIAPESLSRVRKELTIS